MSKTILIVVDSGTMLLAVRMILEGAGYKVEMAADGVKALAILNGGIKPDLIITDVNMPNMGGMELIKQVRSLPGFRFTPILALTTESQAERRTEAKQLGATGWLVKPVASADLLKVIKQVVPGA